MSIPLPASKYCARWAAGMLCLLLSACKTSGRTQEVVLTEPASESPVIAEIIADLRANDDALKDFRAATTFTLTSPKLKSVQRFTNGSVVYRKPADLRVVGRNAANMTLFELKSRGPEFLIEFPPENDVDDRYFCSSEASDIANAPFPVAPADIAHEMFSPIDWTVVTPENFALESADAQTGEATLSVKMQNGLRRQIVVQGKPWRIVHNVLNDATGVPLSDTTMRDYQDLNGVRIPTQVVADFPGESTHVEFALRNLRVNIGIPDNEFYFECPPGQ
ncbi:MAG: hypothetical protein IT366_20315 [Candidatus Hydrogenedentes bacterium]|nr:hypothetical protein [Candidatus Hydrogenedentota bacterium]